MTATTLPIPHVDYAKGVGRVGEKINPLSPHIFELPSPRVFAVVQGSLPAGLSIDSSSGVISGTPTQPSKTTVKIYAFGSNGVVTTSDVEIVVVKSIQNAVLSYPDGKGLVASPISPLRPNVSGLTGSLRYSISSGSLPSGLSLSQTSGVISGTPRVSGTFPVVMRVQGSGDSAQARVRIEVRDKAGKIDSTAATAELICGVSNLSVPDTSTCDLSAPKVAKQRSTYHVSLDRHLPSPNFS